MALLDVRHSSSVDSTPPPAVCEAVVITQREMDAFSSLSLLPAAAGIGQVKHEPTTVVTGGMHSSALYARGALMSYRNAHPRFSLLSPPVPACSGKVNLGGLDAAGELLLSLCTYLVPEALTLIICSVHYYVLVPKYVVVGTSVLP